MTPFQVAQLHRCVALSPSGQFDVNRLNLRQPLFGDNAALNHRYSIIPFRTSSVIAKHNLLSLGTPCSAAYKLHSSLGPESEVGVLEVGRYDANRYDEAYRVRNSIPRGIQVFAEYN